MARMTESEALELYRGAGLHELGAAAHAACCARHSEPWRTYAVDRNINYTNVCGARCGFCAFSVDAGDARAYVLGREALLAKVAELEQAGGTTVLLQGGMNEGLSFERHVQMLRDIRAAFPRMQLHAFSPPEIWWLSRRSGKSVEATIAALAEAGLSSIPGGGAEILADRVRAAVSPRKCTAEQWLAVMRAAHRLGLRTTATMMLGHVESEAERIAHLRRLRELQDESLAAGRGYFTAFICWTFQPGNTPMARGAGIGFRGSGFRNSNSLCHEDHEEHEEIEAAAEAEREEENGQETPRLRSGLAGWSGFGNRVSGVGNGNGLYHEDHKEHEEITREKKQNTRNDTAGLQCGGQQGGLACAEAGAVTYLRTLAIARLYLDNFENLQASWVTQGPKVGQLSLFYGANDMGGVMMEENVVAAAGTTYRMGIAEMRGLIESAGWEARQRTGFYELVAGSR